MGKYLFAEAKDPVGALRKVVDMGIRRFYGDLRYRIYREKLFLTGRRKSQYMPIEKMDYPIDFVVTWVDGSDPEWQAEKAKYEKIVGIANSNTDNGEERYRDWDIFRYWFRAVEKYAPWVRNVFLVTWGHLPEWLDQECPKLKIVKHLDFIPEEYLPTFNCNPIEINLHRIHDLSEHFVYFNDDVFLSRPVEPEDFFRGGLPVYTAVSQPIWNDNNCDFYHMQFTTIGYTNTFFKGKIKKSVENFSEKWFAYQYGDMARRNLYIFDEECILGMCFPHLGIAFKKSTFFKVWEDIPNCMAETSKHKFRTPKDLLHQIVSLWAMMEGAFSPVSFEHHGKNFWNPTQQKNELIDAIRNEKYRMICINDSQNVTREQYSALKQEIQKVFEEALPVKSSFEK